MAVQFRNTTWRARFLLRIGLAFVFVYAGLGSVLQPFDWAGYLPSIVTHTVDPMLLIKLVGAYELALALWLLTGRFTRYAAALSTVTLIGIIAANTGMLIITFRDIGLVFAALALALLSPALD